MTTVKPRKARRTVAVESARPVARKERTTKHATNVATTAKAAPRSTARPNGKKTAPAATARVAKKTKAKVPARTSARTSGKTAKKSVASNGKVRSGRLVLAPVRVVKIRALDPQGKCGPDTSVTELYRVDEAIDGRTTVHLVFFDRHGWYCEHGRNCRAVDDVRKKGKLTLVRTNQVG